MKEQNREKKNKDTEKPESKVLDAEVKSSNKPPMPDKRTGKELLLLGIYEGMEASDT